jgi:ribonuclease HI
MAKSKKKFYVVFKGRKAGIFKTWKECEAQVFGFQGAQYKSFLTLAEAESALKRGYQSVKGKSAKKPTSSGNTRVGSPTMRSIAVDAACNGKTGDMEYQGVETATKKLLFKQGVFRDGTNNVGEFLALVHGLAFLKKNQSTLPIYSDSKTAIAWVRKKKNNSTLKRTSRNEKLFTMMENAENWLKNNDYQTQILKWETKVWGEIPADFGRK